VKSFRGTKNLLNELFTIGNLPGNLPFGDGRIARKVAAGGGFAPRFPRRRARIRGAMRARPFFAARPTLVAAGIAFASLASGCQKLAEIAGITKVDAPPVANDKVGPKADGWLRVEKNKILTSDGKPFHGRGVNLHDTRSCDACTFEKAHPEEVMRQADELVDRWHSNFLRLLLESYPSADGRLNWDSVLNDDAYLKDIVAIVEHIGKKPGVYLEVSLWHDPSFVKSGMAMGGAPTADTAKTWRKLAKALAKYPHVIFGVVNEPESNNDGALDGAVWKAMNDSVAAIREVEDPALPPHLVAVQGTRNWARRPDYYLTHPITAGNGVNIAYEVHVYDPPERFGKEFVEAAAYIPMIISEYGPIQQRTISTMSMGDVQTLWKEAQRLEVPHIAWTFHYRCPPNLLVDNTKQGCSVGKPYVPTTEGEAWGKQLQEYLAKPW
jgi:endoglucanase